MSDNQKKPSVRPILNPVGLHRRIPLAPHQMTEEITRYEDFFSLIHLGVPRIDTAEWSLSVGGMVQKPFSISFDELRALPKLELTSVHQCAGNPMQPKIPTRRVANVTWGGVELQTLLDRAQVDPVATYLWSFGADYGDFDGSYCDEYGKDLPMSRVAEGSVLVAYELNGRPLPAENGFPARLVIPGFYGTNSVKWLARLELADRRLDNLFTTKYYNDTLSDGLLQPVWLIPVESIIVSPAPESTLQTGEEIIVWGWAWAASGVGAVEVFDGHVWRECSVKENGRAWSKFEIRCCPIKQGPLELKVRAVSKCGDRQPEADARNAIHRVSVSVI
ncbi:MAG: molybdopterin-dependent oxidoreductase [Xanthobacteraceae bacterium]